MADRGARHGSAASGDEAWRRVVTSEPFDYDTMVSRQFGFISGAEQATLRAARVFVCGVGGMGGVAAQVLVRAGVGALVIADIDTFEASNLNRQVYAERGTMGTSKAEVTAVRLRAINPELSLDVHGADWPEHLDMILARCPIAVNSMDDLAAGLHLYRRAAVQGCTVIDAYTSPLPNVTVVRPGDPRPEERLGFGTLATEWDGVTEAQRAACREAEVAYVLRHSSSLDHIAHEVVADVLAGRRARPSFAPVVWMSGILMAHEAMQCLLGRPTAADHRGYFMNPWTGRTEREGA